MRIETIRTLVILAILSAAQVIKAQDIRSISTRDGLSNSSVLSLLRLKDGKICFGTCDGINSYDGVRAWKLREAVGDSATGNIIEAIAEGKNNNIWILSDHGLTYRDILGNTFCFYPQFQGLTKLRTKSNGDAFLIMDNQLFYSYGDSIKIKSCILENTPLHEVKDYAITDRFLFIFKKNKTLRYSITEDSNGYTIGKPETIDSTSIETASNDGPLEFLVDNNGILYTLNLVSSEKRAICSIHDKIANRGTISQILDYYGKIFISFKTSGLICLEQKNGTYNANELPIRAGVMALEKDLKSRIVWIGTDGQGVAMYSQPAVSSVSNTFNDLWIDNVKPARAIHFDCDSTLWIGTKGNGIISIPNFDENKSAAQMQQKNLWKKGNGLSSDIVYTFAESKRPILWIGTENGVDYYSYKTHKVNAVKTPISLKYAISIWENGDTLWVVSLGEGIYKAQIIGNDTELQFTNIQHYTLDDGKISSNYFFGMTHDDEGHLWFANRGKGVLTLNGNKLTQVPYRNKYTNQGVNDVFSVLSTDGDLWIGTGCGLCIQHKDGSESFLSTQNGLPNNTIHALLRTKNGSIVATTNNGIANFMNGNTTSLTVFNNSKVSEYSDGAATAVGDKAILGGTQGITTLHYAEHLPIINVPNKIVFTSLYIMGHTEDIYKYIQIDDKTSTLTLDYTQNTFDIGIASLDYAQEPYLEYEYRLSHAENWIKKTIKKEIQFFRLPYGHHTLQVKYKNRLTGQESEITYLNIVITPPWYWAWYAKIFYLAIIATIIVIIFKLTWRHQQERQQREINLREQMHRDKMYEEKLNFLTNVVHELNTPLTLIYGPCERILGHNEADNFVRKYTKQIIQNLGRINYLIQEIIDFRRVTTGHHAITLKKVNVTSFISDIAESFQELADRNHITFEHDIAENIIWNTDERAIVRIASNLVSNAFKYTQENGKVKVNLSATDDYLRLTVYNTGKGITNEEKKEIFNYYSIFEHAEEGSKYGLNSRNGLGMAICHKMVEKLGGKIVIESIIDKYAEFIVTLPPQQLPETQSNKIITTKEYSQNFLNTPTTIQHEQKIKIPPTLHPQNTIKTGEATILAIDDNQEILNILIESLDNYNVITALNAEDGIMQLKETLPDLIITDLMMPGVNGLDLIQNIKQNKHTMHIPLVILSAKSSEEERIEGLESGADVYISKPFSINYLQATINRLLENRAVLKEYYNSSASAFTYSDGKLLKNEDQQFINEIKQLLDKHMSDSSLTTDTLAGLLHISPRSLYRRFSDIGLTSPKEFVRNHRLDAAAKLLTTTTMTVQEILFDCGFNTRTQFYSDFRKRFGMTPKDYRDKYKHKDDSL